MRLPPVRPMLRNGVDPRWASALALTAIVAIMVVLSPFQDDLSRATKALLLVLPVIGAAAIGGRVPGYVAAGAATVAFSLSLPPIGSVRVQLAEDALALAVFVIVALVASTLVTLRIESLDEVDRQRSMLLRSVSHDLRTPLASIRAVSSELLHGPPHHPASQRRLLELVETEAERLDRLVANLLDLGRIESGGMEPRKATVDPVDVVEEAAQGFRSVHPQIVLRLDLADSLPAVPLDPTQIGQVLTNLLDNAARHSPAGGTVQVGASVHADRLVVTVDDQGPGVAPEEAELIFQPFRSGTLAGSSGVGLAVSRAVVHAHGGTIRIDDGPLGGARFRVELPLS